MTILLNLYDREDRFTYYAEEHQIFEPPVANLFILNVPDVKNLFFFENEDDDVEYTDFADTYDDPSEPIWYDSFLFADTLFSWGWQATRKDLTQTTWLWPFWDITVSKRKQQFAVQQPQKLYFKKYGSWKSMAGRLLTNLLASLFFSSIHYFIRFTLVGTGFFCRLVDTNTMTVCTSFNHDIVFSSPRDINFVVNKRNVTEIKTFGCLGTDYVAVQRFAHYIRSRIKFNIYEFRGLLYYREFKKQKPTKRKTR